MLNSAYNFVPLSENVFFPIWSDKVSMDIPFEDGISGELNIELTADTDIYTRESYPRTGNQNNNEQSEFFRITKNGEYAIPGTSIKGVIRNVLEIASFSKIRADNKRYSIRDLSNPDPNLYTNHLTETVGFKKYKPKVEAGWLIENEDGEHIVIPCEYARIEESEIEAYLNNKLNKNEDLNDNDRENKHIIIQSLFEDGKKGFSKTKDYITLENSLSNSFKIDPIQEHDHNNKKIKLIYRKAHFSENNEGESGYLVFTGQCGRKHMEFVFFNPNENSKIEIDKIDPKLYKDFCFIHSNPKDPSKPNAEWEYWKSKMQKGKKVPVFYLKKGNTIVSMGLAMMYRLAYNNTINDAISHTNPLHLDKGKKDFSETLFGYINKKDALRGRVVFSTMKAIKPQIKSHEITTILGSPKPTFYPYYMHQDEDTKKYKTFMDSDCKINGWKRYPFQSQVTPNTTKKSKVTTTFKPLPKGTKFKGKIHLHNVKPSELGGLIWALRFGNNPGCHHSVGMAKPYGYGAATIRITSGRLVFNNTLEEKDAIPELDKLQLSFVKMMEIFLNNNWSKSEQILNLLAMAQTYDGKLIRHQYPTLKHNEFVNIKKRFAPLPRYLTSDELRAKLLNKADAYLAPIKKEIKKG